MPEGLQNLAIAVRPLLPLGQQWARLLLVAALVSISWAATTSVSVPATEELSDKLLHALAFGALATIAHAAFPGGRGLVWSMPLLLFYGFAIELVQSRLPYRSFEWLDLAADAAGLGAYLLLGGMIAVYRRRQ